MFLTTPTISKLDGVLDLVRSEVLPDGVLAFEELLRKGFVDDGYLSRGRGIVLGDGAAEHDLGTKASKKPGITRAHPALVSSFAPGSGRPCDANPVVPAIPGHRRVQRRSHHPHTGNLSEPFVDPAEQGFHLLRLVGTQGGIDPRNVPALSLEPEILVLQVAQALAQQGCCGEQDQRHRGLRNHQRSLRPGAAATHRPVGSAERLHRVGTRSHPRWRYTKDHSGKKRHAQRKEQHRPRWCCTDGHVVIGATDLEGQIQNQARAGICHGDAEGSADHCEQQTLNQRFAHSRCHEAPSATRTEV